jgi:hypothetical protein
MTRSDLVIFIEGKENDPVFYSEIAAQFVKERSLTVAVWRSQEMPGAGDAKLGGSGGKYWLLKAGEFWLRYASKKPRAIRTRVMFALDKDLDDLHGKKNNDPHFVYTQGCTVENYFLIGNDVQAVSEKALSLLPNDMGKIFASGQKAWVQRCAILWSDWIVFSILAAHYPHSSKIHGYSARSKVNSPYHSPSDPTKVATQFEALRSDIGANELELIGAIASAKKYVDSELAAGREHQLMKGDWFIDILFSELEANDAIRTNIVNAGKSGIWAALRSKLVVDTATYEHYEGAFLRGLSLPY